MYALAIHGGAGTLPRTQLQAAREQAFRTGLTQALAAGERILANAGSALDAVEAAVTALEDDPLFNAGRGAVLTREGMAELDAAIMEGGQLRAGAVAQVRTVRNPVQLARRVLQDTEHVLLVGDGAERFALASGLAPVDQSYFVTDERRQQLQRLRGPEDARSEFEPPLGTVGAVALDHTGLLAAATSTGGTLGKLPGRVGDSPVIGAGTYADNRTCAVSCTGHGEWFLRLVQAYDIAARLRYGRQSLAAAVDEAVLQRMPTLGATGGLIALDAAGEVVMRFNTASMFRASVRAGEPPFVGIY